jgi:hypothetical protein
VPDGETVFVSQRPTAGEMSLVEALGRPNVSQIVLTSDLDAAEATAGRGEPLKLNRSVAITSVDPADPRVLDFRYARNRLALCGNCTLALRDVVIARDRKGNGGNIDFIVADPWAKIIIQNVQRLRVACLDPQTGIAYTHAVALGGHDAASVVNATFRGQDYPNSYHGIDAAARIDRAIIEGIGWTGGYDVVRPRRGGPGGGQGMLRVAGGRLRERGLLARRHS